MATLHKLKKRCKPATLIKTTTIKSSNSELNEISSEKKNEDQLRKEKLLKIAPKVPYDVDLYHWEDENLKAPTVEM